MCRLATIPTCVVAALLLSGCALWRPATVPLRTVAAPARCERPVDTLLVLLPGSYSLPEDFVREGFVKTVRERHLRADIVMVDAHVGYYQNRSVVVRLADDVIQPARAKGYRHVWLAGISIGGVGAMLYADAHPDDVDGVVLLAPYLGTQLTAKEVRVAGGLARWPAPLPAGDANVDPILWRWLQRQTTSAPGAKALPLFLGYGLDDRFAYNHAVLAEAMPPSHVFTVPGGHDWPAWRPLWERVVGALPIAADARCAAD